MEYNGAMPADAGCTARRRRRGFARIRAPCNQATLYGAWDFVRHNVARRIGQGLLQCGNSSNTGTYIRSHICESLK